MIKADESVTKPEFSSPFGQTSSVSLSSLDPMPLIPDPPNPASLSFAMFSAPLPTLQKSVVRPTRKRGISPTVSSLLNLKKFCVSPSMTSLLSKPPASSPSVSASYSLSDSSSVGFGSSDSSSVGCPSSISPLAAVCLCLPAVICVFIAIDDCVDVLC